MIYILSLLFLVGVYGAGKSLYKDKRKQKIKKMIEIPLRSAVEVTNKAKDISPLEKLLKKNNKTIILAEIFDRNIILKTGMVLFFIFTLLVLEHSRVLVLSTQKKIIIIFIFVIFTIFLPNKIKKIIIDSRIKRISDDLPFVIDMMAVCVQSGMTIESAIRYLSVNTASINPDISVLLRRVIMKMEVSGISGALEMLNNEVPCQEVRMLSSSLQQSVQFGSSVYTVLLDLSKEMREIQLLTVEEKVSKLAAKMSLPMIVFIMFPILLLVGAPGFIRMMALWSV